MAKKKIKLSPHQQDLVHIDLLKQSLYINSWELEFVTSIAKQTLTGRELTARQRMTLQKLVAKHRKLSPHTKIETNSVRKTIVRTKNILKS